MSLKVLLADDSMTAQNMGKKILAESGYDVTTVSNGAAAVKKIAEVKPDVVILDIYMPGYTGLEVCERVRANMDTANLPVLLTVGKMEPYRAEDGAKVRADGVIVKPFEATDLLAVVKKMAEKAPGNRRAVAEPEPEPEEEIGQPEPAMPASVDVPSELASTPALVMEEFTPAQPEVAEFVPTMEWTAAAELPVEQASMPSANSEPQLAEVPWSFDQIQSSPGQQAETAKAEAVEPSSEIEFTSAPKAGYVEVEQVAGLEAGLNAEPTADLGVARDPGLTDPTEMTDFVTSFGETQPASAAEVAREETVETPSVEAPAEVNWDGWAHAEPTEAVTQAQTPAEAHPELPPDEAYQPKPVIDDFEAKVAAAMAGFGVEPVETQPDAAQSDFASAQPADDFETRVAAAMSGFATEPVDTPAPESAPETHEEFVASAAAGFGAVAPEVEPVAEGEPEVVPVEEAAVDASKASVSQEDFDARIAQALAAFDTAPEVPQEAAVAPQPALEAQPEPEPSVPSISLNEAALLPQETMLSLEEEMKQALAQHVPEILPTAPVFENPPAKTASQTESAPLDQLSSVQPEPRREFAPVPVVQSAAPVQESLGTEQSAQAETVPEPAPAEKFADAVQRAFDRLKPQFIAEIVKELKKE